VRAVDGAGAFAVVEDWEGFLWGWDVAADRSIHKLGPGPHPCDLGFVLSPDAKTFACAKDDGTVSVWAPSTGALLRSFGQAQGAPRRLAFLPDGRTLAVALADGKTSFWDVERGAASRAAIDTSLDAIELLVPAAGELLVLGRGPSEGGAVRLYALAKDLPPRSWPDRLDGLTDATLSPSGQVLAVAASRQRAIGLWRVADAEPLAVVRLLADGSAAWATTPDGAIEAFGDPAVVEARAVCRLAASTLPFDVCRDRFVTRGLVRGLLANNDAWRDP
jgi:WD40 repeat protein